MKVFSDLIKSLKWKMDENGNEQKRVQKKISKKCFSLWI